VPTTNNVAVRPAHHRDLPPASREMRQMLHGEAAVAADEARELQVAIVDADL